MVSIPKEWSRVPTFFGIENYTAEIQIRTLPQHTWAEASKRLHYKQEQNVPRPLLRSIGRVSALLETVDLEFERLLLERQSYRKKLETDTTQRTLNVDLLENVLDSQLPQINKTFDEGYNELLEDLLAFKVDNTVKLINLIKKGIIEAIAEDKSRVQEELQPDQEPEHEELIVDFDRLKKGCYYSHAGLIRAIMGNEYGSKWTDYMLKSYK